MKIVDRNDLKKEESENTFEYFTPVSKVVRELFQHELSDKNWRKYSKEDMISLIEQKVSTLNIPSNDKHIILLRGALKKSKTREDVLFKMENFLLGGSVD